MGKEITFIDVGLLEIIASFELSSSWLPLKIIRYKMIIIIYLCVMYIYQGHPSRSSYGEAIRYCGNYFFNPARFVCESSTEWIRVNRHAFYMLYRFLRSPFNYTWRFSIYLNTCIFCLKSFTWMQFRTSWLLRMHQRSHGWCCIKKYADPRTNSKWSNKWISHTNHRHLSTCIELMPDCYVRGKFISFVVRGIHPRISIG